MRRGPRSLFRLFAIFAGGLFIAAGTLFAVEAPVLLRDVSSGAPALDSSMPHTPALARMASAAMSRGNDKGLARNFSAVSGEAAPHLFWFSARYRPGDARLTDVVAAGDVMMGSRDEGLNPDIRPNTRIENLVGPALPAIFRRADIAFANLEGALYDGDDAPAKDCGPCYAFRSPTNYASLLAALGLGAVSLANNHSGDFGDVGRAATIAALRANGIGFFGLDRDGARFWEFTLRNGSSAAIVSFAPNTGTLDINDLDAMVRIIRGLKAGHALVVVSFHGGGEGEAFLHVADEREIFDGEDRGNVVRFAHAAIDAGADMVTGQGPHIPRALEIYRGRLIAYGLGNFWTYRGIDTSGLRGTGPVLEAWLEPNGTLAGFATHSSEQRNRGVPRLDPSANAERIVLELTKADFPATWARLDPAHASAAVTAQVRVR